MKVGRICHWTHFLHFHFHCYFLPGLGWLYLHLAYCQHQCQGRHLPNLHCQHLRIFKLSTNHLLHFKLDSRKGYWLLACSKCGTLLHQRTCHRYLQALLGLSSSKTSRLLFLLPLLASLSQAIHVILIRLVFNSIQQFSFPK